MKIGIKWSYILIHPLSHSEQFFRVRQLQRVASEHLFGIEIAMHPDVDISLSLSELLRQSLETHREAHEFHKEAEKLVNLF